jgi:hypothetical protein
MFAIAVGMALGFALMFGGFGTMFVVALFGAIAFVIVKVAVGDVDVARYIQGRRSDR